jgi:hypothetical protein
MKKNEKPSRVQVVPVQERSLTSVQGGQHVDNPGQSPMKDGE